MKIAIIGAGAMGGAMAEGLLKSHVISPSDITIANPTAEKLEPFAQQGASVTTDNEAAAEDADIIVIAVKPWIVEKVVNELKDTFDYRHQSIVVVAAGITSQQLCEWFDKGDGKLPALFLAIPNIAIVELQSMTFLVPVKADQKETDTLNSLFNELGQCLVTEERLLGAGTTLASCGIAYAMRYVRAAVEGGVELGFKANEAEKIVLQTVKGAVDLLQATGEHPEAAIDKVTTPGGVTIRGLNEMEHAGFSSAVIRGLKAGAKA